MNQLDTANSLLDYLQSRINAIRDGRRRELSRYVRVGSRDSEFFYTSDATGYIQTKQDADFVCQSIMVAGDPEWLVSGAGLTMSIEDMGPGRMITQGLVPATTGVTQADAIPNTGYTIPVASLTPMYGRDYNQTLYRAVNVDYWYAAPASFVVPRGDTLRAIVYPLATTALWRLVLCGYKVYG